MSTETRDTYNSHRTAQQARNLVGTVRERALEHASHNYLTALESEVRAWLLEIEAARASSQRATDECMAVIFGRGCEHSDA